MQNIYIYAKYNLQNFAGSPSSLNLETNIGKTFLKTYRQALSKNQQVSQNIQQKQCQS